MSSLIYFFMLMIIAKEKSSPYIWLVPILQLSFVVPLLRKFWSLIVFFCIKRSKRFVLNLTFLIQLLHQIHIFLLFLLLNSPIKIYYITLFKFLIKVTPFSTIRSISDSETLSSASLKLSLVDLIFEDFSSMIVFESKLKLTDILGCVRKQNTVTMNMIIEPFSNVLYSIVILEFISFDSIK